MKITVRNLLLAATLVTVLNFMSCSKYEDGPAFSLRSKKARLVGEWEVVKITDASGMSYSNTYDITMEFEKDGDFTMTASYSYSTYSYSYSQTGDWEWADDKEAVSISLDGSNVTSEWTILKLKNNELDFRDSDNTKMELEAR